MMNQKVPTMPFPEREVDDILKTTGVPSDKRSAVIKALQAIWTQERRKPDNRRMIKVQRLEIESGKIIWYYEEQRITGFERRSGQDRRLDMT